MKRRAMDLSLACICLAVTGIVLFYSDQIRGRAVILAAVGILGIIFLFLAVRDGEKRKDVGWSLKWRHTAETGAITEIVLLSEEDTELMTWNVYGKTAMVIGRDVKENQVDIDLGRSHYASMVEIEHAVLNYSAGNWYVEDLGSANGIRVKKAGDGKVYQLSADTPCQMEREDCLYVGLNRLLLR
ncbi:MAG: FHA domain-containing protein [Hungatella sp.]|jgi:hypothetical protein|nr:FHA domain-containing protein [Hungatella sp.]